MPDYRLIHRRALRGEKVAALTDFERGVWLAYLLVADDYGVMPFDAGELARAGWLKAKAHKTVQKALERVREIGLIQTWTHQGTVYCYAYDWQEWQNVRHPRGTIEPCPPADVLASCKPKTQQLFADHSRIADDADSAESCGDSAADFGKVPQMPRLARAGGRETLTLTANASANVEGGPGETRPDAERVSRFMDRYRELHQQYVGVAYLGNPQTDYREACTLVATFEDAMLDALSVYWLNDPDKFATDGTRTIAKLRSRASKYAEELKAKKLA